MPQSPLLGANDGVAPQAMFQTRGGALSKLNMTAANVIKVGKGRLARVVVLAGGITGGAFTLNDSATVAGAAAANVLWTLPQGAAAGTVVDLDMPFTNGLVLSSVPTAGSPILAASYR
jgi:hypothetical protein